MVLHNRLGDLWLDACSGFNGFRVLGFAFPAIVVIRSTLSLESPQGRGLLAHEETHQRQGRRYGYVGYPFVYAIQFIRYGYWKMPLELEAYAAQAEAEKRQPCS